MKAPIPIPPLAAQGRAAPPPWFEKAKQIAARAPSPTGKPWEFVAAKKKGEPCKLYLWDAIGVNPWDGSGIDPLDVVRQLEAAKGQDLEVHINSPGGYVFDGIAIFNAIRTFDGKNTVHVDALAASIASVIALAGDKVVTHEGAQWMVHDPAGGIVEFGTADQIENSCGLVVKALRQIREAILDIYVTETGRSVAELSAWMSSETWMSAEDALARGFTDEVQKSMPMDPDEPMPMEPKKEEDRAPLSRAERLEHQDAKRVLRATQTSRASPGASPGQPGTTPQHPRKP